MIPIAFVELSQVQVETAKNQFKAFLAADMGGLRWMPTAVRLGNILFSHFRKFPVSSIKNYIKSVPNKIFISQT